MSTETLNYTGQLVVVSCWCGIRHAIPDSLRQMQLDARDKGGEHVVYCPLGHQYIPTGESETNKLRRQLEQKQRIIETKDREAASLREQRDAADRRTIAQKAAKTRIKNRIAKGICPCCHRHFVDLHSHMDNKHPEFVASDS